MLDAAPTKRHTRGGVTTHNVAQRTYMIGYGIVLLLVGCGLFAAAAATAIWLHRRYHLPYALLTVGIITYSGSLLVQVALLQLLDRALLGILPVGALALGVTAGFSEEIARLLGFQYLARSTVTRPQALMIGAGHGFTEAVYTGLVAIGLGLSVLADGTSPGDDLGAIAGGAIAESLNALLPVALHMALSWLVLQVFLRGQLFWLFIAIFAHGTTEITATLLGPADAWAVVLWRALVALISASVIVRLRAPEKTPDAA